MSAREHAMPVLITDVLAGARSFLAAARREVLVLAPFLHRRALEAALASTSATTVQIITTWRAADVVRGASDLDVFAYATARGFQLSLLPPLHAKLLVIDRHAAMISTANITGPGRRASGLGQDPARGSLVHKRVTIDA